MELSLGTIVGKPSWPGIVARGFGFGLEYEVLVLSIFALVNKESLAIETLLRFQNRKLNLSSTSNSYNRFCALVSKSSNFASTRRNCSFSMQK